ncbi:MAG: T9SS type A sorting domain-containing protein [Calditrichaeota bacterium]|nr:T9SS type A sorting domain-containing protein [Calditrichota bacterium]
MFVLYPNYPNPFNGSTVIAFEILRPAPIRMVITDILGREITTLLEQKVGAGKHDLVFNAFGLPSGPYYCWVESTANEAKVVQREVVKMINLR